jgi:cytochrome bd ubiquinol oxidase subunit I
MLAVSAWHLRKGRSVEAFGHTAKISLVVLVPAIILAMFVGSELGVVKATYQPMKVAAAEAQWTNCQPCSFSASQVGGGKNDETPTQIIAIPHLLSILATNHWNGAVEGLTSLNAQYQKQYGPGNYVPNVFIPYWSMRVMAYIASLVLLLAVTALFVFRARVKGPAAEVPPSASSAPVSAGAGSSGAGSSGTGSSGSRGVALEGDGGQS